jgi:pantoate--beta-alanine ligase
VEIVGVPTVREVDGVALSSRNVRLNARERALAPELYRALQAALESIRGGETDAVAITREAASMIPANHALRLEYLDIVDPLDLQPLMTVSGPALIAGALWVGSTRLIDNVRYDPGVPAGPRPAGAR